MRPYIFSALLCFGAAISSAAVTVDLTGSGTATLTSSGVILDATSAATTVGTGVIDSFVRMQGNGTIEGYNTDAPNPGVEDDQGGIFTHSILLSDLDTTTKPGYYTFLLDINQTAANPLLSLDQLQIRYGTVGNISTEPGAPTPTTLLYDFQTDTNCSATTGSAACSVTGTTNEILLNYSLNNGSGNGFDMFLYVPTSVFAGKGVTAGSFIYLYSKFGGVGGDYTDNDGFEEWALIKGTATTNTPEPVTSSLIGGGLIGLFFLGRRARKA